MKGYARGFKRLLDLAIALIGLVGFLIPMIWIAWRISRELGPPVLFRQNRLGYGGKPFTVLKFRTMRPGEEGVSSPFCRRLRATAMDELPQLVNILRGEMSFVGPRPLIPEELAELRNFPRGGERLRVRPGLTGLAQLRSDKVPSLPERLKGDLEYIDRCSLSLDLWALFCSMAVTLRAAWEKPGSKI